MSLCQNWDLLDLSKRQGWDLHRCCCLRNLLNPLGRKSSNLDGCCRCCYWCNVTQGSQLLWVQLCLLWWFNFL